MDTVTYTQSTGNPTVLPQATSYQYDQLNRLVEAQAYQNIDPTLNKWLSGSTYAGLYNNKFVYDANGNILSQQRRDSSGTLVDNLVYHYAQQAGHTIANRLYHVNDSVTTTHTTSDIEDQGTYTADLNQINYKNNYSYDPIGNLSKDSSEQIATIQWSVYGKIKAVYRTAGSNKKNILFDYDPSGNRVAKRVLDSRGNLLYVDYYTRDAQGNIMAIYKRRNLGDSLAGFMLKERNIYGSSMIGTSYDTLEMIGAHLDTVNAFHHLGNKNFFLENHLGNVLATVSDKKIPRFTNGILDHYEADIISSTDYYGFGQEEEGRNFNSKASRYGFNGKMKDNEVEGEGDVYDYGKRMYDVRLGRWLSVDPLQVKYANYSPYNFSENNPIYFNDKDGKDAVGKVEGNTITVSTTIIIYGEGANKAKAAELEKAASGYFVDTKILGNDGKEYNVKFNISVKVLDRSFDFKGLDEGTNIVKLADKVPDGRSGVRQNYVGLWSNKDEGSEVAHEVGHFFGLADQYVDLIPNGDGGNDAMLKLEKKSENLPGVEKNELMGVASRSKSAKLSRTDVKAIANFILDNKDKTGKAVINKDNLIKGGHKGGLADPNTRVQKAQEANERGYSVKQV